MLLNSAYSSARATVALHGFDPSMPGGYLSFDRVLFLDFDGVLHPELADASLYFCFMTEFCRVLRKADPLGHMPIVISSDWRLSEPIAALRNHFTADIQRQIVGVTPDLLDSSGDAHPTAWESGGSARHGLRQREVLAWMGTYAPAGQWLAIDDKPGFFSAHCPQLFAVPGCYEADGGGISASVAPRLLARLQKFLAG